MKRKILIGLLALALSVAVVSANLVSNTVTYSTTKTHLAIAVTPQTSSTSIWDNETVQLLTTGQLTLFLTVTVTNTTSGATSMTPFPFFFNTTATQGKTTMGNAAVYTSPTFTIRGTSQKQMQPPPIEDFSDNMSSANDGTTYSTTVTATATG